MVVTVMYLVNLINRGKHMRVLRSYECLNACIINHLNLKGITLSGSDVYFVGEGFFVNYEKGSLTKISTEGYDANFRFLEMMQIPYKFGCVNPTKQLLMELLGMPYTITIRMVSDCLSYDYAFAQTSGATHFINVLEYDDSREQVYIVDGDVPTIDTGCFSGWIDVEELLRGWILKGGELLQLDLRSHIVKKMRLTCVKQIANKQVVFMINQYLLGKKRWLCSTVTGQYALEFMIEQLAKYVETKKFTELIIQANFRIRINGVMGAKYFLLEKFIEQKSKVAEDYRQIVQNWSRWCMLLLKSGYSNKREAFALVQKRLYDLMSAEEICLKKYLQEGDYGD